MEGQQEQVSETDIIKMDEVLDMCLRMFPLTPASATVDSINQIIVTVRDKDYVYGDTDQLVKEIAEDLGVMFR